MSLPVLGALLSFGIATGAHIWAKKFLVIMIGEINGKRTDEEQVSDFGYTPSKRSLIVREYRRACPSGRLVIYYVVASAVMLLGLAGTMIFLALLP